MTLQRKVTLSDVARRAGVSTTTASYILNGRSAQMRISADTEQRVREAVAELGYRPNQSARSLRTASTATIGVISDFVASGHFASQMLTGAGAAARRSGRLLVIGETEGDPDVEVRLIEEMLDRQVDGIIYVRLVTSEIAAPALLQQHRAVLLNCVDPRGGLPAVLPDEYEGGRTAAEAVLAAGIAGRVYVVGQDPTPEAIGGPLRLKGVRARMREAGRSLTGVVPCDWAVRAAYDAVDRWLGNGAHPAALICLNDRVAMGTYQALATHELDVPRDVSVVSFDGSELAGWLRPRLTSVALPYAALGARAVHMLLDPAGPADSVVRLRMPVSEGDSVRRLPDPGGASPRGRAPARRPAARRRSTGAARS